MVDIVVDTSKVLKSLHTTMQNDPKLANATVVRMRRANRDPSLAYNGWIGLYTDSMLYEPRVMSGQRTWNADGVFRIIVQVVDHESTEAAHERLEKLLKHTLDAALGDPTFSNLVDAIQQMRVDYAFNEDVEDSMHFIGALVTIDFVGTTK